MHKGGGRGKGKKGGYNHFVMEILQGMAFTKLSGEKVHGKQVSLEKKLWEIKTGWV